MPRVFAVLLASALAVTAAAAPAPERAAPETFLVQDGGVALLRPDGREEERLNAHTGNGALSPDGRRLAYLEFDEKLGRDKLVIRPRSGGGEPATVPLVWGTPAQSGCLPVWAADGRRLLIGESRAGGERGEVHACRAYELATGEVTERKLPDGHTVTDWSRDGKRFLTTVRTGGAGARVAWLPADGTGDPEFLTPEDEVAFGARLSPEGRRVLYQAGPQPLKGRRAQVRLYAMDLASGKRTAVDEPGETHGYCWSPDGSRVAYTWQQSLDKQGKEAERETLLITCDPDGANRKTVTSRRYKPETAGLGVVFFFWVCDWR